MAGACLTTASVLLCPHGGTVTATSANVRAMAGGAPIVTAADVFVVGGCPFTLPGPTPSPCVLVQWVVSATRLAVGGPPALDASSVGLCIAATGAPQGTVVVQSTQTRVTDQ